MLAIMITRQVLVRALLAVAWLGAGCSDDAPGDRVDAGAPGGMDPLAETLAGIEGVVSVDERGPIGSYRQFEIRFEQPVDHGDLAGPRFTQKLTLLHRDVAAPMVLASTGYHDFLSPSRTEPTTLLDANQIVIEHRYFGESRPEPLDWAYLDIAQAASDHHRVVTAFEPLYPGAWISTGASKGGSASVFHRRFYPGDVDGTIAYVAPISFEVGDTRYASFFDELDQALGDDCVERVRAVQRRALIERDALEEYFAGTGVTGGYTFERMGGLSRAFETAVVELEWTFWQYWGVGSCPLVPDAVDSTDVVAGFIDLTGVLGSMSDQQLEVFEPYYYQSGTEMGYPGVPFEHLADLLRFDYEAGFELVLPDGLDPIPAHDPAPMRDVADWLASEGERILFVYGAHDPWTAGQFELGQASDSYLYLAPATNHGATIGNLAEIDRQAALEALSAWAGSPGQPAAVRAVEIPALQAASAVPRPRLGL
jgi:hypothetical protein